MQYLIGIQPHVASRELGQRASCENIAAQARGIMPALGKRLLMVLGHSLSPRD
jgi:hypothetical protein